MHVPFSQGVATVLLRPRRARVRPGRCVRCNGAHCGQGGWAVSVLQSNSAPAADALSGTQRGGVYGHGLVPGPVAVASDHLSLCVWCVCVQQLSNPDSFPEGLEGLFLAEMHMQFVDYEEYVTTFRPVRNAAIGRWVNSSLLLCARCTGPSVTWRPDTGSIVCCMRAAAGGDRV